MLLQIRGRTWRRISVEVSADEGLVGARVERFPAPSLKHFGLTGPKTAAGIVVDYQVAQKLHACTDPHTSEHPNDRVRDVIDLHLLKSAFYDQQELESLAHACRDLFAAREEDAIRTGEVPPRSWPPTIIAYPHWQVDHAVYANAVGLKMTLHEEVEMLNFWIEKIDRE